MQNKYNQKLTKHVPLKVSGFFHHQLKIQQKEIIRNPISFKRFLFILHDNLFPIRGPFCW
mgnify:CR=1 FL=1